MNPARFTVGIPRFHFVGFRVSEIAKTAIRDNSECDRAAYIRTDVRKTHEMHSRERSWTCRGNYRCRIIVVDSFKKDLETVIEKFPAAGIICLRRNKQLIGQVDRQLGTLLTILMRAQSLKLQWHSNIIRFFPLSLSFAFSEFRTLMTMISSRTIPIREA